MKYNCFKSNTYKLLTAYNVYYRGFVIASKALTTNYVLPRAAPVLVGARSFQQIRKAVLTRLLRPCFLHWPQFHTATQTQNPKLANPLFFWPCENQSQKQHDGGGIWPRGSHPDVLPRHNRLANCAYSLLNPIVVRSYTWPASLSKITFGIVERVLSSFSLQGIFFAFNINMLLTLITYLQFTRPLALKQPASQSKRFAFLFLAAGYGVGK